MKAEQNVIAGKEKDGSAAPAAKNRKKMIVLLSSVVVVAAIVAAIFLIPSKFERVMRKCGEIKGDTNGQGTSFFVITTIPDDSSEPVDDYTRKALEAIRYADGEFGFPADVYSQMLYMTPQTTERCSAESGRYSVIWECREDGSLWVRYTETPWSISDLFS